MSLWHGMQLMWHICEINSCVLKLVSYVTIAWVYYDNIVAACIPHRSIVWRLEKVKFV